MVLEFKAEKVVTFLGRKRDEASAAAVKLSNAMMPANDKSIRQQRSSQKYKSVVLESYFLIDLFFRRY
mgnify:CR=1 FL=1